MGISVDITGWPSQTDAEVAKALGVSVKRQKAIAKIIEEVARQFESKKVRKPRVAKPPISRRKAA